MKKLFIILTDPMQTYFKKGEIKKRYYNPCDFFDEVHMVSFCNSDIDETEVPSIAGNAKLWIYPAGKINVFSFFSVKRKITGLIEKIKPDVLRAYDPSLRGYLLVKLAKKFDIPAVISIHTDFNEDRKHSRNILKRLRLLLEVYSLRNATKIICVSNYVAEYARRYGAKNVEVIYNRIDNSQFNRKVSEASEGKPTTILCIGRLDRPKRQDIIIKAIEDLNVKLMLIGSGLNLARLKKLVNRLGLDDKVNFLHAVPHEKIHKYYHMADIFAIATEYEGFCIPVGEAMAAALPVVASDIPVITELTGDSAILVRNNPHGFKDVFVKLMDQPQLRLVLGERARARALSFDSNMMEKKEALLYGEILEGHLHKCIKN